MERVRVEVPDDAVPGPVAGAFEIALHDARTYLSDPAAERSPGMRAPPPICVNCPCSHSSS
jgi:hypothetical protein